MAGNEWNMVSSTTYEYYIGLYKSIDALLLAFPLIFMAM